MVAQRNNAWVPVSTSQPPSPLVIYFIGKNVMKNIWKCRKNLQKKNDTIIFISERWKFPKRSLQHWKRGKEMNSSYVNIQTWNKMNAWDILRWFNFLPLYIKAVKLKENYVIESFPLTWKRGFTQIDSDLNHGKGGTHRMTH